MRKHQLQVHKLTILSMMIALDVVLTPIFRIEGMAPMSSVVNILAGIMMGPVYALAMATVTAFIRMTMEPFWQVSFISTVENFTILL
ncbi:ThiW superfamily protein [Streptococcus pneumoniae]|nr:ThiW superfamily protein [Streptococcus pneumoniae]